MDFNIIQCLSAAGVHIAQLGLRGEFQDVYNYGCSKLDSEALLGKTAPELLPGDKAAERTHELQQRVVKTQEVAHEETQTPRFVGAACQSAKATITPRFADKDKVKLIGTTQVLVDITEQTAELQERNKQLQEATQAKADFLSMMSHEIRTPLNGVLGMLQLLNNSPLTDEQKDFARTMYRSAQTLLRIIGGILDFSKLEAAKVEFTSRPFSLCQLVSDSVALVKFRRDLKRSNEFITEIDPSLPPVLVGDGSRVFQILTNLLNNAAKFTNQGTITTRATRLAVQPGLPSQAANVLPSSTESPPEVKATAKNMVCVQFEVEDTGIGISQDFTQHLFEPFTQAKYTASRMYGGTGLGLAICKKLVEAMGGVIGVQSTEGKGSKFWLSLTFGIGQPDAEGVIQTQYSQPSLLDLEDDEGSDDKADSALRDMRLPFSETGASVVVPTVAVADVEVTVSEVSTTKVNHKLSLSVPSASPPSHQRGSSPKPLVLVAEDNPINQKVLVRMLGHLQIDSDVAHDGQQAVDAVRSKPNQHKAVFMDCMMPIVDGTQATKEIRELEKQDPSRKRLPIIATTAHVMDGVAEYYKAQGMDDYLAKPIILSQLSAVLKKHSVL